VAVTETFVPAWVAFDRKVLRFEAFFKEPVHESPMEAFRVRKCVIYYYLEDDSIHVSEPKCENSGIPQGVFIKRHRIPKPDSAYEFYTYNDLAIGAEVTLYSRTFRLVQADKFTESFYEKQLGKPLGPSEAFPDDPYSTSRDFQKTFSTAKGSPFLSFPPNRKFDDLTQFVEAKLGMATHVLKEDRLKQFLDNDRKVLRFFCIWDDSARLFGDKRPFSVHYFLADDTVEVLEVQEANSGRDPFPCLLKRCRLPRDPTKGPGAPYISPADLGVGKSITVFSKNLFMYACDGATRGYYNEKYGVDMAPIKVSEDKKAEPMMEVPPHNGYGDPEDSVQNVLHLIQKPPKKDFAKFMNKDGMILRFQTHLVTDKPEDVDRQFIIAIYLADDTVAVYEPPMRNSGIIGGKFLERGRVTIPGTDIYYKPRDFFVGAKCTLYSHEFLIHKCDQYTLNYMESHPALFPLASPDAVVAKLKAAGVTGAAGTVDVADLKGLAAGSGVELTDQEVIALLRKFDSDGTGSVDLSAAL